MSFFLLLTPFYSADAPEGKRTACYDVELEIVRLNNSRSTLVNNSSCHSTLTLYMFLSLSG